MSDAENDDWHALAAGGHSTVGPNTTTNRIASKSSAKPLTGVVVPIPFSSKGVHHTEAEEASNPITVALDTVVATIGLICVVIILLAVTTDVFEGDEDDVEGHNHAQNGGLITDSKVDKRIHALLEGTIGKKALISALAARAHRKAARKQHQEVGIVERKVRNGEILSKDAILPVLSVALESAGTESEDAPLDRSLQQISEAERSVFDDDASFYVSIAQFKDVLCPNTIAEIYSRARNPKRVFAGIVDQRDKNVEDSNAIGGYTDNVIPKKNLDGTCFPWYMMKSCGTSDFCPTDNIRVRHSWPKDGKGPTWGRYYAMLMYQGESYFMMIDSHSRFSPHWDMHCVLNLQLVPKTSKKAVLSHYPGGFESYNSLMTQRRELYHMTMCSAHYTNFGIIRMDSQGLPSSGYPIMQAFSAGGFVVGDAKFVHEVPFDPYLFYVFDGEEVLYSVRLWTHGYDLFTPKNNILFHHYARHGAPRFWSIPGLNYAAEQQLGQGRVKYFMKSLKNQTTERMVTDEWVKKHNVDREEDIYGLGKVRTLEDYYTFAGADPVKWTVNNDQCFAIQKVDIRHKYNKEKKLVGE